MRSKRAFLDICLLAALHPGTAQLAAQTAKDDSVLRVEVLVQNHAGHPVANLTAQDFVATQNGQRLPVAIGSPMLSAQAAGAPAVPTRMLVILDARVAEFPTGFSDTAAALKPAWRQKWHIAIARSDGYASNYAASAKGLQKDWTKLTQSPAPAQSPVKTETAVQNLESFLGRRIVLYVGNVGHGNTHVPHWLHSKATKSMAEIFIADGGILLNEVTDPDGPSVAGPRVRDAESQNPPSGVDDNFQPAKKQEIFHSGELHLFTLQRAIKAALRDASGYYDLNLLVPPGSLSKLTVQIPQQQSLLVRSQIFANGPSPNVEVTAMKK